MEGGLLAKNTLQHVMYAWLDSEDCCGLLFVPSGNPDGDDVWCGLPAHHDYEHKDVSVLFNIPYSRTEMLAFALTKR